MNDCYVGYVLGLIVGSWLALGKDLFDIMMFTGFILFVSLLYFIWLLTQSLPNSRCANKGEGK